MATLPPASPAFGEADLSNCEREQIHLAGCIQPHGALLAVRESTREIAQASANAGEYLGLEGPLLGRPLSELPGDLHEAMAQCLDAPLHEIPSVLRCSIGDPGRDFDCLFHRPQGGGLVIELERAGPELDLSPELEAALAAIRSAASLQELADESARIFKGIAGYDRAMVYRFDDEGHGEILAERRNPDLDSYLGQRYPASDIPQIARRLYERNRVRVLVDVGHDRVPVEPRLSPISGVDLDMSLCFLRAHSPIHIQYLKNMGVAATLVASLMVGGRLWGLIACHHYSARAVQYEIRAACELLAEAVATRIAALESFAQAQAELSVRRLEQRIAEVISRDGDWKLALFDSPASLLHPLNASGAALVFEDEMRTVGEVPGTHELRRIASWLDGMDLSTIYSTASLGSEEASFESLAWSVSGLAGVRISTTPGEYLLWFRRAQARTVTWGGNPFKPFLVGSDPSDLSPRRSFAQWHQQVEGTSEPWTPADLAAAKLIGETVADIVLQFRSVRVLVAQDQLDTVRRQVQGSEHPVIIADPEGQILLTNEAFEGLLRASHTHLHWITDLPALFTEPAELRGLLTDLVRRRRSFRSELDLQTDTGEVRPLLVRGDPVVSAPDRVLGHVLLVSDLRERRAADAARQRFQNSLVAEEPFEPATQREAAYAHIRSSVQGNAQLAALEIMGGLDPARMPPLLESLQASVDRSTELLDHLATHAQRVARAKR